MLILTRKREQSILIGDDIEVIVTRIDGDKVRLGVVAPPSVKVDRREVREGMKEREDGKEEIAMSASQPVYVATAYRWGNSNGHHYVVCASTDKDHVLSLAKEEQQDRGGKYGVQVEEYANGESRNIAYFPSMSGESSASLNRRMDVAENLGLELMRAFESGTIFVPAGDGHTSVPRKVDLPQWLSYRIRRDLEFIESMDRVEREAMKAGGKSNGK